MSPPKLNRQLFLSYLLIMGIPVIFTAWYASHTFNKFYMRQNLEELTSRAWLIGSQVEDHINHSSLNNVDSLCKSLFKKVNTRFTVISLTGKVLGDSEKNPDSMENHLARSEVLTAISGGIGVSNRYSQTLQQNMLYTAVPVYAYGKIAAIVRTSVPSVTVTSALTHLFSRMFWAILLMTVCAAIVSYLISRRISLPINAMKNGAQRFASGNFNAPLPMSGYKETRELAIALNEMAGRLSATISQITEKNHELDAILSSMREGVIAIDASERLILVNNAAAALFTIDKHKATGRQFDEVLRNDEIREFLLKALNADEPMEKEIDLPLTMSDPAAAESCLQLHGSTLHDPTKKTIGALMVINDITQIKKLENIKQDFIANVSHELRTPVTSIKGFVETLAEGAIENPEEARRFLGILTKQADRLHMIVDDLLSLSRIERDAEKKAIDLSEGSVVDVLSAAIETCSAKAHLKNIAIECVCEAAIIAKMERTLLEQAVTNLIDNAINYSRNGACIWVRAAYTQSTSADIDSEVVISVEDEGVGIEQEHLSRLFERFYRVDKARSRKMGGTGLGLSIVKHTALALGGRVDVLSTPGKGSTFFIYLPRA
jgi:two-component system, OmpR family, phosphate regulon sensor histidine kinase PhoR